ncbi:hypothetical protein NUSPORA_00155 [Nucleospora cyclopteri]
MDFTFFNVRGFGGFNLNTVWVLKPSKYPKKFKDNFSSKVMLPTSILSDLTQFNYPTPYVFEIMHENKILKTNCTVGNFMEAENEVIVPTWIWDQLDLKSAKEVSISHIIVPTGKSIKLLPHSTDFLKVENPKAELETALRNYHILTLGDEIRINFEEFKNIAFTVTSIEPEEKNAIYIVDTDLNVEFEEPIGYQEEMKKERTVLRHCMVGKDSKTSFSQNGLSLFLDFDLLKEIEN